MAQTVKNLPAVQETRIRSLGQEDTLKKEMATHSSILAWKIPWIEEPGRHGQRSLTGYSPWVAKSRTDWAKNDKRLMNTS